MTSEIEAQRKAFEADYLKDNGFWIAKNPDGSYKNTEIQDAWLLFLKGWEGHSDWVPGLVVADTSFIPKE